jgi:hypothetical protein
MNDDKQAIENTAERVFGGEWQEIARAGVSPLSYRYVISTVLIITLRPRAGAPYAVPVPWPSALDL